MTFMSIFCLNKFKEHGTQITYPAKKVDNPEGGFYMMPLIDEYLKLVKQKMSQSKERGGAQNYPAKKVDNPEGGFVMVPFFGKLTKQSEASTKPVKPKKPKPIRPPKGVPAHKKLHANPHPILAECEALMGKFMQRKQCEADSASITPAVTAAGQGKQKETSLKIMASQFKEAKAATSALPNKFRVVLLQEGMGNSHDAFYYSREALESAVPVFQGQKIFADHPTEDEEQVRPERSTRDILGHYENLAVEDNDAGQGQLCGDVNILPSDDCEWARHCMVRAVENAKKFPDNPFIGLSINASGPSEKLPIADVIGMAPDGAKQKLLDAQSSGIEIVRVVSKINRAVSCDLVTEAGAGGKILNSIEGDTDGQKTA